MDAGEQSSNRSDRGESDLIALKLQPLLEHNSLASPVKLIGVIHLEAVQFIYPNRP